jgi:mono/diheme cytochrome c family protein
MARRTVERSALLLAPVVLASVAAAAQEPPPDPARVKEGSAVYAQNCSPCHGVKMQDPQGAFDLRTFPHGSRERFLRSVTQGKGSMPPWDGVLTPEEIDSLWAYVLTGGRDP